MALEKDMIAGGQHPGLLFLLVVVSELRDTLENRGPVDAPDVAGTNTA
jgi:hypothetical protein